MIYKDLTIEQLVERLNSQAAAKIDLVTSSSKLRMQAGELVVDSDLLAKNVVPNEVQHHHIAEKLGIPWNYYSRCMTRNNDGGVLDANVNQWFAHDAKNYLVRLFDQPQDTVIGRALLSDRYKPIDNLPILFAVLQAVKESGLNLQIETADITEKNLYVRFIAPDIEVGGGSLIKGYRNPSTMNTGDGICSGFVMRNSEVGHGSFTLAPRMLVKVCANGMVMDQGMHERRHVGAKLDEGEYIWSRRTEDFNEKLIISQVQDWVTNFTSKEYLEKTVKELTAKGDKKLEHPIDTVVNVTRHHSMSERAQKDILNYFTKSGDMRAIGVSQAVTYYAHQQENPDLRNELEIKAVKMLDNITSFDYEDLKLF